MQKYDCTGRYPACAVPTPSGCTEKAQELYHWCISPSCGIKPSESCVKKCAVLGFEFQLMCWLTDRTACQSANQAEFRRKFDGFLVLINGTANDAASSSPAPAPTRWLRWLAVAAGIFAFFALAIVVVVLACVLRRRLKAQWTRRRQSSVVQHALPRTPVAGSLRSSRYSSSVHPAADASGGDSGPSALRSPLHSSFRTGAREGNAGARAHAGYDVLRLAPPSRAVSRSQFSTSTFVRARSGSASTSARLPVRAAAAEGYDSTAAALAAGYDGCNATMTSRHGYIAATTSHRL